MLLNCILADDHRLFREGMKSLLLRTRMIQTIREASNGIEVLELTMEDPPDIIFMDIRMPELDGIETTRAVLKVSRDIKIIALTMMDDALNLQKMKNAGAAGYLLKNTSFFEVTQAIHAIVKGNKFYSPEITSTTNISEKSRTGKRSLYNNPKLTRRERDVMLLICQGLSSKQIADELEISEKTVQSHRFNIHSKLHINNMAELVNYAVMNGYLIK